MTKLIGCIKEYKKAQSGSWIFVQGLYKLYCLLAIALLSCRVAGLLDFTLIIKLFFKDNMNFVLSFPDLFFKKLLDKDYKTWSTQSNFAKFPINRSLGKEESALPLDDSNLSGYLKYCTSIVQWKCRIY